jgi:cytochrome c-type biogenesis protein CcmH/NrfF
MLDRYDALIRHRSLLIEPGTWLLWSAPMLLLVIGLGAMTWQARRRRHHAEQQVATRVRVRKV